MKANKSKYPSEHALPRGRTIFKPGDLVAASSSYYYATSKGLAYRFVAAGQRYPFDIMLCIAVLNRVDSVIKESFREGPWYAFLSTQNDIIFVDRSPFGFGKISDDTRA